MHVTALTLLAWAALWLGRPARLPTRRADTAFAVVVLSGAAWMALRLLAPALVDRSPLLWRSLPDWTDGGIPVPAHLTTCLTLALPPLVLTLCTAWWNRTRADRLFWLTVMAAAVITLAAPDLDWLLGAEFLPLRSQPRR